MTFDRYLRFFTGYRPTLIYISDRIRSVDRPMEERLQYKRQTFGAKCKESVKVHDP